MSPANEKRSPKRRSLAAIAVVVAAGMVGAILFAVPAPMPAHATESEQIVQTEVCFKVHVIGDPFDYQVSGTLFHDGKTSTGPRTALLLQHGSAATRSSWDGERPHVTGVRSIVRPLAAAGYDVFAVDRLGYGRSPYVHKETGIRGSGWNLTQSSYVRMTHEMVTQIREVTFHVGGTAPCAGGAPPQREKPKKVVLMGISSGGGLSQYYATKQHIENLAKIDGIVSLIWSNQGASSRFLAYYFREVWGQFAEGKDYVYFFKETDPTTGYSQTCEDFLFYKPGVSEHALAQLCGPEGFGGTKPDLMPSGDTSTTVSMQQEIKLTIGNVGPTPALLVFARQDAIFTNKDFGGEDTITPEMKMWERCNCDVTFLWQENAGHGGHFHRSSAQVVDGVLAWLRGRGH